MHGQTQTTLEMAAREDRRAATELQRPPGHPARGRMLDRLAAGLLAQWINADDRAFPTQRVRQWREMIVSSPLTVAGAAAVEPIRFAAIPSSSAKNAERPRVTDLVSERFIQVNRLYFFHSYRIKLNKN